MKTEPLISIITVTYNSEKHLEETITSLINQDYDNYEYLIIDGGSTDNTLNIINKYEDRLSYWISESDDGMYDALNKGIKQSNGQVVGQINSDDKYHKDIFTRVAELYSEKKFDMLYGDTTIIDEDGHKVAYKSACPWQNMYYGNPDFLHSACFFSRSILEKVNRYSVKYKIASDIDLFQKVHLESDNICIINEPFSIQRRGGMSQSGMGPFKGFIEYRNISIKNGLSPIIANYYLIKKSILRAVVELRDKIKSIFKAK